MNLDPHAIVIVTLLSLLSAFGAAPEPEPRRLDVIKAVLAKAPKPKGGDPQREITVVLVADTKDHGPGEHDYPLWQKRWSVLLGGTQAGQAERQVNLHGPLPSGADRETPAGAPRVHVATAWQWPNEAQWKAAHLVVLFCYVGWNEQRFREVEAHLDRGRGLVLVHSATWTKPEPSPRLAALAGVGGFTQWRHGQIELKIAVDHPICLGLPARLRFTDETYWPPTPAPQPGQIRVLAASDEKKQKASAETESQPVFWTFELGKGRVFGCVLGHHNWTFDDPYFRILLLRGMAWSAGESPYRFDPLVLRGARVVP